MERVCTQLKIAWWREVGSGLKRRIAAAPPAGRILAIGLLSLGMASAAKAQPVITQEPESAAVAPGTRVTMSVAAQSDTAVRYYWWLNGRYLISRKPSVSFIATSRRAGTYRAWVKDAQGRMVKSQPAVVRIKPRPVILVQPHNVTVREHDTAVFRAVLNNSGPYTTIVWHNDNPREGPHQIPDGLGFDVHSPTLAIPNSLNVDYYNGVYWLAVTNQVGGTVSRKVILTVVPQ